MAFNIVPPKVANVSEKAGETENMLQFYSILQLILTSRIIKTGQMKNSLGLLK